MKNKKGNRLYDSKISIITERVQVDENALAPVTLDIVIFPGCGDHINNSKTPEQIGGYLEAQFTAILNEETRIKRNIGDRDNRPHVCLYFITPNSSGLREFDIELMKQLGDKINIIPVVAKADLLTEEELLIKKELIMRAILINKINVFNFKNDKLEDSLMELENNNWENADKTRNSKVYIRDMLPFSIICSDDRIIADNGEIQHVREYQWGRIIVEDPLNSDFIYLKSILLGSHLQEFKDITNDVIYENYRTEALVNLQRDEGNFNVSRKEDSNERPISSSSFKRRNAFSVTIKSGEEGTNFIKPNCKELKEKNKVIEEYKRKIASLERRLTDNLK